VENGIPSRDDKLKLTFWVKTTHAHELEEKLQQVSDPSSKQYGHYLSKAQVNALTKPKAADVATVQTAMAGYTSHSENDQAVIWAEVSIRAAEQMLGGRFTYFCHTAGQALHNRICVLRNPTAMVPSSLRSACDVISPIDDPFPPVDPLPGPIVQPEGNPPGIQSLSFATAPKAVAGCCFAFGYGDMMRPCCLDTERVSDVHSCIVGHRIGGVSSYSEGECPATAKEAADLVSSNSHHPPKARPHIGTTVASASTLQTSGGCCFSFGYGAQMTPCCLETKHVSEVQCQTKARLGGATGYSAGECPTTPEEAARLRTQLAASQNAPQRAAAHRQGSDTHVAQQTVASGVTAALNAVLLGIVVVVGVIGAVALGRRGPVSRRQEPFLEGAPVE
jgi:hypothetical protein